MFLLKFGKIVRKCIVYQKLRATRYFYQEAAPCNALRLLDEVKFSIIWLGNSGPPFLKVYITILVKNL